MKGKYCISQPNIILPQENLETIPKNEKQGKHCYSLKIRSG